ncbi:MAG TPA: YneF family protein [Bacilli bacterium]|nr:YneF family protein [Bacilli bacterium]
MILMSTGGIIGLAIGMLLLGGVAGFFIAQKAFKVYLKKNPPISEKQIRTMLTMMGRKPSEKQVREIMRSMQQ